jgi:ribosomal protein S18 acetylase RimI-like enzyme
MALSYLTDGPVKPAEILALLGQGGFPRPLDDPERTQKMLDNGSFYVTVRTDHDELVGWIRVLTDYVYYGLVTEVAVAPSHKGQGVGKEMLRIVRDVVTPKVTLVLTSSEEGEPFYAHLGWQRADRAYRQRRTE